MNEKQPEKQLKQLVRIVNTDLDGSKTTLYALREVKGIGTNLANALLRINKINPALRLSELSHEQIKILERSLQDPSSTKIPKWLLNRRIDPETGEDNHLITTKLILRRDDDIKLLKKIKTYRGVRHILGQPTRGQRTRSNFRVNKGKAKLGVIKSKAGKKSGK